MTPLLFDLKTDLINNWFNLDNLINLSDSQIMEQKALSKHFEELRKNFKLINYPLLENNQMIC